MSISKSKCHPNKNNAGNGLCVNCYYRKKRRENPEKTKEQQDKHYLTRLNWMRNKDKNYRRNSWLRSKYDITLKDYEKLLEEQNYMCILCGRDNGSKPLNVDHDHKTGRVRGLLCLSCNQALGKFGDNIEGLQRVIKYLEGKLIKFSKEV